METVLIGDWKILENMEVAIGDNKIGSKRDVKYLEMIIDDRQHFKKPVKFNGEKQI